MKVYAVISEDVELLGVYLTKKLALEATGGNEEWISEVELNTGGEPIFVLRGQDLFASAGVREYRDELLNHDQIEQADQVQLALEEFLDWQDENSYRLKIPDHQHVPATGGTS